MNKQRATQKNKKYSTLIGIFLSSLFLISCGKLPGTGSDEGLFLEKNPSSTSYSNYIIAVNNTTRSVVLLSPTGQYVKDIIRFSLSSGDIPYAVNFVDSTTVMVSVDHATATLDRVVYTDFVTGTTSNPSTLISNVNLTAAPMRGLAKLTSGNILVVESSVGAVEQFTSTGTRITTGGWPLSLQTTGTDIKALPSGGFILCSTGTDVVRTYNSAGTQLYTVSSGIGATTDAFSCDVSAAGAVAVAWNGTTDTIRVYTDSTLSVVAWSYSNTTLIPNPVALAYRPNGNLLVVDGTYFYIYEFDSLGNLVATYDEAFIQGATSIRVVP